MSVSNSISNHRLMLKRTSNSRLLENLNQMVRHHQAREAGLIEILGEVDARRLYLKEACPSMFDYCVRVLRFTEGVAYKRIAVARAVRTCPELLSGLASGEIHLTAACLIAPHLKPDRRGLGFVDGQKFREDVAPDIEGWLALARHSTVRDVKRRIAERKPKPDVETSVRRLPAARSGRVSRSGPDEVIAVRVEPAAGPYMARSGDVAGDIGSRATAPATAPAAPVQNDPIDPIDPNTTGHRNSAPFPDVERSSERDRARVEPLGTERYAIRIVVDERVHEELEELRALLRHSIPDGDVAKVVARAIGHLLGRVRQQKFGNRSDDAAGASVKSRPRPRSEPKSELRPAKQREPVKPTAPTKPKASRKTPPEPAASAIPSKSEKPTSALAGLESERPGRPARSSSRHIPVAIRREVWARDRGRCAFVSAGGRKCSVREFLEFHHRLPWAHSAEHTVDNISLRCRAHNQFEAEIDFGLEKMARFRNRSEGGRVGAHELNHDD